MRIIPVIDLGDDRAVRGTSGDRLHYRPVASRLGGGAAEDLSDPAALLSAYRERLSARTVYVADLDRIERRGSHGPLIGRLVESFPEVRVLWDGGFGDAASIAVEARIGRAAARRLAPILATETLESPEALTCWRAGRDPDRPPAGMADPVLGLDLDEEGPLARSPDIAALGEEEILRRAARHGAREAVVVVLRRVGTGSGLPRERLRRLRDAAPDLVLHAGGGIASIDDLDFLSEAGFAGALLASALHDGVLTPPLLRAAGYLD